MSWAAEEMVNADFGDIRLSQRVVKLLNSFSNNPQSSIPNACKDWYATKAAYRFFDNKKVTLENVLLPHKNKCIERIKQEKRILMVQDTTELNYSSQKDKRDVGPGHSDNDRILFLHPLIAVTPDKVCLGISDLHYWHREELRRKTHTKKELQTLRLHHQHISEKESYRWLLGYRQSTEVAIQCQDTHIIMVADRESDISDIYDEAQQTQGIKADWLIRAKVPNRVLLDEHGERDTVLLRNKLLLQVPSHVVTFTLPRRDKKPAQQVTQEIRTLRVQIHPPTGRRGKLRLRPFWVTALLAKQINGNPPKK